ncbi:hypothetical protein VOLCADRAFT_119374, partial [Volvox carteri f. nagariensis]
YVTAFGQTLRVVGSLRELGCWNPRQAPMMNWCEGHQWVLECVLPQQSFEFKDVRWEGGSNRVVHAEDEGEGGIPVEIVVWLTCHFNATSSTQLQLAVPRASIQDAYETGMATLEFLKLRQFKLGQVASSEQQRRRQHSAELARLSGAVAEQRTLVHQLSDLLNQESGTSRVPEAWGTGRGGPASSGGAPSTSLYADEDDEDRLLLLAIDSVRVPKPLRRIAFVQSWTPGRAALLPPADGAATNGPGAPHHDHQQHQQQHEQQAAAVPTPPVPVYNPFLRGELDSQMENLTSAAEALLQELKALPQDAAVMEWASLAQEAGQVAAALQALAGGDDKADGEFVVRGDAATSALSTQLQMQEVVPVSSAVGGDDTGTCSGSGSGSALAVFVGGAETGVPVAAGRLVGCPCSCGDVAMQLDGQVGSSPSWDLRERAAAGGAGIGTGLAGEGEGEMERAAAAVEVRTGGRGTGAEEDRSLSSATPLAAMVTVTVTDGVGVVEGGASAMGVVLSEALVLQDAERETLTARAAALPPPAAVTSAAPKAGPLQHLASSLQGQLREFGALAVAMLAAMKGAVGLR